MKSLSHVRYTKSQRIAISALISFLFLTELGIWLVDKKQKPNSKLSVPSEIAELQVRIDASELDAKSFYQSNKNELQKFNPNELNETEWQNLGFSSKQAVVILKYKNSLGGRFSSKKEISECFVISEEKFKELAPYILLPEYSKENPASSSYGKHYPRINYRKFDPNKYSQNDWVAIGFSEKQALSILKYKRSLGGKFTSLEQIEKCFVISEDKFKEMRPYIILPRSGKQDLSESEEIQRPNLEKFDPNELSREQWIDLGFTEKQVNTIFNYKRSLGGKFKDAETLKKCYSISDEKFLEIEPYLVFE